MQIPGYMGGSLNGGNPISHPSFLVGTPMGLLGKPTILGTPPISMTTRENTWL